jgi:predicted MFS family arabinose efflux permease
MQATRCAAVLGNNGLAEYSSRYKRLVLLILTLAYAFNAMDRGIISIIGQAMKGDLGLSDTQLGLLSGTAFAALYAFGGIPIARLAERLNRVNIISVALVGWSGLTLLCGLAGNFTQLLLSRAGVGIAESGCTPPAHSLISDYFEPARRTSALSVYSSGISVGYVVAALAGGYAAQNYGWRAACAIVGLPGVILAVALKLVVREPARAAVPKLSIGGELTEMRAVAKTLIRNRRALNMILGVTVGAFANYGFYGFAPLYFNRAFGLNYTTTGRIAALTGGVAVGVGIVAGGYLADRLGRRSAKAYALVPAVGTLLATPFYLLTATNQDWRWASAFLAIAGFFQYASLGPTFGVVQNSVAARRRATATALLYIFLNVVALGGGPVFTGWVIDRFVAQGSPLPLATRHGLLMLLIFYAWASLHYFRAALTASSVQSDSI